MPLTSSQPLPGTSRITFDRRTILRTAAAGALALLGVPGARPATAAATCTTSHAYVDATKHVAQLYGTHLYRVTKSEGPARMGPFKAGDVLTISAEGTANAGTHDYPGPPPDTGPEGRAGTLDRGALFGMMDGVGFYIGSRHEYTVAADGMLELYYFDTSVYGNTGGYDVTVVACHQAS